MRAPPLPAAFLRVPLAHRALHDRCAGRPENSRAAIRAAVAAGYGIELDLQISADAVPMVFHDRALSRLTEQTGLVCARSASDLGRIALRDGGGEGIPTLAEGLALVRGRVPLLLEIKDQDGALGPGVGALERATADLLRRYRGPVAAMSFNPHAAAAFRQAAPDIPCGLTTGAFGAEEWPLGDTARARLREIPDFDRIGAAFISHERSDLARPRVQALRAAGVPVLCYTVRSPAQERAARRFSDNITFEGYSPARAA